MTGYLFRRANGNMCIDGEHGVIKIDFYPDIRKNYEDKYRYDQWFADVKYEDALYTYKGVSE